MGYCFLRNGVYCEDRRNDFKGESEYVHFDQAMLILESHINWADIVVAHSKRSDLRFLQDSKQFKLCSLLNAKQFICTQKLHSIVEGKHIQQQLGLLCKELGIETDSLHNAGNDAYYTMMCFQKLCTKLRRAEL